ncbi:copper resistance CopC family protein [Agrococcus citreus]|uniref:CopC domain-containing protein n=1 Tax=Agrococcus citreus TaxID=84643 RepID=A0ABN1YPX2_9MICO
MFAAIIAVGVAVLLPAHASVTGTTPEDGSILTEQPGTLSVTMNEEIIDVPGGEGTNALELTDDAGLHYGDGCVTVAGDTISLDAELGGPGRYTLEYQVVSADGHPVSGQVAFTFEPADDAPAAAGSSSVPTCADTAGAETPAAENAPTDEAAAPLASPTSDPVSSEAPGVDPGTDSFGALPSVAIFVLAGLAVVAFIAYRLNRRRKHIGEA